MSLLRWGTFTSNAGRQLPYKFDLDGFDDGDWNCVARMIREEFSFGAVEGVPTGGLRISERLRGFENVGAPLLIVDDVLTTGGSMERQRGGRDAFGIVVLARGQCPRWVVPILTLGYPWAVPQAGTD